MRVNTTAIHLLLSSPLSFSVHLASFVPRSSVARSSLAASSTKMLDQEPGKNPLTASTKFPRQNSPASPSYPIPKREIRLTRSLSPAIYIREKTTESRTVAARGKVGDSPRKISYGSNARRRGARAPPLFPATCIPLPRDKWANESEWERVSDETRANRIPDALVSRRQPASRLYPPPRSGSNLPQRSARLLSIYRYIPGLH